MSEDVDLDLNRSDEEDFKSPNTEICFESLIIVAMHKHVQEENIIIKTLEVLEKADTIGYFRRKRHRTIYGSNLNRRY